jgi:hypothetical protein
VQLGKQVAWACVGLSWTFVVTYAIMFVINLIPGCKFRATMEAEIVGMDVSAVDRFWLLCSCACLDLGLDPDLDPDLDLDLNLDLRYGPRLGPGIGISLG